jgi:hypothetical protein
MYGYSDKIIFFRCFLMEIGTLGRELTASFHLVYCQAYVRVLSWFQVVSPPSINFVVLHLHGILCFYACCIDLSICMRVLACWLAHLVACWEPQWRCTRLLQGVWASGSSTYLPRLILYAACTRLESSPGRYAAKIYGKIIAKWVFCSICKVFCTCGTGREICFFCCTNWTLFHLLRIILC